MREGQWLSLTMKAVGRAQETQPLLKNGGCGCFCCGTGQTSRCTTECGEAMGQIALDADIGSVVCISCETDVGRRLRALTCVENRCRQRCHRRRHAMIARRPWRRRKQQHEQQQAAASIIAGAAAEPPEAVTFAHTTLLPAFVEQESGSLQVDASPQDTVLSSRDLWPVTRFFLQLLVLRALRQLRLLKSFIHY